MKKKIINIAHLYPEEMNIYGDTGNRIIIASRLRRRGYDIRIDLIGVGTALPSDADIIIGGGGQDAGQLQVQDSLITHKNDLHKMADQGVVMLVVCGLYQLFGRRFITNSGQEIRGIGLLPLDTIAGQKRFIGNTLYNSAYGEIIGYENHSGLTTLDSADSALWHVIKGTGNNGSDGTEGCNLHNVFGTYSHGPVLSKNPQFADLLISRAIQRKYPGDEMQPLDDTLEAQAANIARSRPR